MSECLSSVYVGVSTALALLVLFRRAGRKHEWQEDWKTGRKKDGTGQEDSKEETSQQ